MPEASKTYDVLAYFHAKDDTGTTVFYHPDGDLDEKTGAGWPGAKKTFRGDPSSDQVKDLLAGAGGSQGPLIAEKGADSTGDAAKKTPSSGAAGKEN